MEGKIVTVWGGVVGYEAQFSPQKNAGRSRGSPGSPATSQARTHTIGWVPHYGPLSPGRRTPKRDTAETMKETDSTAVSRATETEGFANRKLIRPTLRSEHARGEHGPAPERRERAERAASKKTPPPEQTHAENFYYQKQMQSRTPMVVVLRDGEKIHGVIEWYDKNCIKVNRANGQPNLLIYKPSIKYLFKEAEAGNGRK